MIFNELHVASSHGRTLSTYYLWYLHISAQHITPSPLIYCLRLASRIWVPLHFICSSRVSLYLSPFLLLAQWGWPVWITSVGCCALCLPVASSEKGRSRGQSTYALAPCHQGYFELVVCLLSQSRLYNNCSPACLIKSRDCISTRSLHYLQGFPTHTPFKQFWLLFSTSAGTTLVQAS